jgi:hypothetical protein
MLARLVGLMTLLLTNFAFANVCDLELSQNISNRPFQTNIKIDPEFNKLYLVVVIKYRVEYKELPAFLDPSYFPLVYNELKPVQKRELQDYLNRALELPLNDVTWGDFSQNKILLLYVTRIKELLLKHKIAVGMSLALHNGSHQKYGNKNYDYHIRKLRAIAKRFGFGPKNSIFGLKLGTVLWLHDAPEDQDLEISLVRRLHGNEIANAVWGMTNVPKTSEHRELAKKCKSKSCTSEEKEHLANLY